MKKTSLTIAAALVAVFVLVAAKPVAEPVSLSIAPGSDLAPGGIVAFDATSGRLAGYEYLYVGVDCVDGYGSFAFPLGSKKNHLPQSITLGPNPTTCVADLRLWTKSVLPPPDDGWTFPIVDTLTFTVAA